MVGGWGAGIGIGETAESAEKDAEGAGADIGRVRGMDKHGFHKETAEHADQDAENAGADFGWIHKMDK
jgi:hypothetical protein